MTWLDSRMVDAYTTSLSIRIRHCFRGGIDDSANCIRNSW